MDTVYFSFQPFYIPPNLNIVEMPVAFVDLKKKDGKWQTIEAMIDSGACVSVFKKEFVEGVLELDIKNNRLQKLGGVGGGGIEVYIHKVDMKIGCILLEDVDVGFCKDDGVLQRNLLGIHNIFDQFKLCFENRESLFIKETLKKWIVQS